MIQMNVTGSEQVRSAIRSLAKKYPRAMAAAVYKLGVAIMSDALPRVPVEFGVLRASHYVAPPDNAGTADVDVEVGFGTVYAVPQHERMDYRHPRGGQAKYLESAVRAVEGRALDLLARWAQEAVESGAGYSGGLMPSRPANGNGNVKKASQAARLRRGGRNVRRRTGR